MISTLSSIANLNAAPEHTEMARGKACVSVILHSCPPQPQLVVLSSSAFPVPCLSDSNYGRRRKTLLGHLLAFFCFFSNLKSKKKMGHLRDPAKISKVTKKKLLVWLHHDLISGYNNMP